MVGRGGDHSVSLVSGHIACRIIQPGLAGGASPCCTTLGGLPACSFDEPPLPVPPGWDARTPRSIEPPQSRQKRSINAPPSPFNLAPQVALVPAPPSGQRPGQGALSGRPLGRSPRQAPVPRKHVPGYSGYVTRLFGGPIQREISGAKTTGLGSPGQPQRAVAFERSMRGLKWITG